MLIQQQPLSEALKAKIFAGFSRHAIAQTGYDEKFESVAFVAKDQDVDIGAVVVEQFWGSLHIKYVYVDEEWRHKGVGTKLMEQALEYAKSCYCPFAFVETMSFQARKFYEKLGFRVEFTRSGYKHETSFHYLRKDL